MRLLLRSVLFALCVVCAFGATHAHAQSEGTIGVWAEPGADLLRRRLVSELRVRGYTTEDLVDASALEGLSAGVWMHNTPAHVRVCVLRSRPHCEELAESDTTVLLIRAVEAIRAQLGEPGAIAEAEERERARAETVAQTREGERPGTVHLASVPAPASPITPFAMSVHADLALPLRGLSTGLSLRVLLEWNTSRVFGFELGGSVGIIAPSVSDETGNASASLTYAWVGAHARFFENAWRGHALVLGVGAGLGNAQIRASAVAPFQERESSEFFGLLLTRATLSIRLGEEVALEPGVIAGIALPTPVLLFAEREVAHVAAPFVALSLGVRFSL